jgi:hypothetical protein
MSQTVAGGCACGAIRYETDATPVVMLNCHCRDCQRASGSGYAAHLVVPKATVRYRANGAITRRLVMVAGQSSAGFVWSAEAR